MPIIDLYEAGSHRRNLAHFATLASLAAIDGEINAEEKKVLDKFAHKLDISKAEYKEIMKKENKYPIETPHSGEKRLKRLFDFFQIIFSDNEIDEVERSMVEKYAIGLGFPTKKSTAIIEKSIAIFTGKISFDDYHYLMEK
ncbi:MAG: TerB family tellurite resistance protein [Allomuricauda sp.]|nr:MAG: TerB family tellurite resistance protein [Allomuricauda sp.]